MISIWRRPEADEQVWRGKAEDHDVPMAQDRVGRWFLIDERGKRIARRHDWVPQEIPDVLWRRLSNEQKELRNWKLSIKTLLHCQLHLKSVIFLFDLIFI